jgi:hypothetical protein
MKVSTFLASSVLACAVVIAPLAHAEGEHSMTGCLAKAEDGKFGLTNVEGGGPTTVAVAASTTDLAGHVGHKVELTGTTVEGAATHTMNITAMKHLAATCP